MKIVTNLAAVSKMKLAAVTIGFFLTISVMYAVLAINSGNSYDVFGHYDPENGRYVLTIETQQAEEETIFLSANHEALVSAEMFENLAFDNVDMRPAEIDGITGIEIDVFSSQDTVTVALPIIIGEEESVELVLKRKSRTLKKVAAPSLHQRQTLIEQATADQENEERNYLENSEEVTENSESVELLTHRSEGSHRIYVSSYPELREAFNDQAVGEIVFLNDIIASYTNENNNRLTALTRSVSIDGNGYTLQTPTAMNNNGVPQYGNNYTGRFFELATTHDREQAVFELKNLTIAFQGNNRASEALIYQQNISASNFWTVKLENIVSQSDLLEASSGNEILYLQRGSLEIRGKFHWFAHNNPNAGSSTNNGVLNATNVLITEEADVNITNHREIFRLLPADHNGSTVFRIEKGSIAELHSISRPVIWANQEGHRTEVIFEADGEDTKLNVSSKGTFYGADGGGVIGLVGQRDEQNNKFSRTVISNGAIVNSYARDSGRVSGGVPITTAAFVNQVSRANNSELGGNITVTGPGSQFNLLGDGEAHNYSAVLRFRLVGEQTFVLDDHGQMNIVKYHGHSAAVRMYGRNNEFYIESAGQLNIFNHSGTRKAQDDGMTISSADFPQFDRFSLKEREFDSTLPSSLNPQNGSDVAGQQGIQFAVDGGGTSIFHAEGEKSRIQIYAHGGPAVWGQSGAFEFLAGKDATFRMEGRTHGVNNGAISSSNVSNFIIDEPLFYDFRNNRPNGGQAFSNSNSNSTFTSNRVGLAVWEKRTGVDLNNDPNNFWNPLNYRLGGANFVRIDSPQAGEAFSNEFNSTTFKGGNAYTRISANNYPPKVQHIAEPTNADKTFYAKVVVPYEYTGEVRDAWEEEVWVEVALKDESGNQIETQWLTTKSNVSVYGEVHSGIIAWSFDELLKADYSFEVLSAHRGLNPNEPNVEDYIFIYATEESIEALPDAVIVDVTPPAGLQVSKEQHFNERTRTVEGIYTPEDDRVKEQIAIFAQTAQGLLRDSSGAPYVVVVNSSSGTSVPWQYDMPRRLDPDLDIYIEFYAKDFADDLLENFSGDLPNTTTTEPNGQLGNTNPSAIDYEDFLGYRDAVGEERFKAALYFEVTSVKPSNPSITLQIPQSFDRDELGNPIITEGNQFILRAIVESNDSRNSGKDDIENAVVTLDFSPNLFTFFHLNELAQQDSIESASLVNDRVTIRLAKPLSPGDRLELNLTARVDTSASSSSGLTPVVIFGKVSGNQPETGEILQGEDSITIQTGSKAFTGELVTLAVENSQLKVYFSNLDSFDVYMDGTFYKTYDVQRRPVTDSVTLDIPVHDIRNLISVHYIDQDGVDRVSYWNNNWDFVN